MLRVQVPHSFNHPRPIPISHVFFKMAIAGAIAQLKKGLGDVIKENAMLQDDLYLLLWLRARKMVAAEAAAAIKASFKWRKENGIAGLEREQFPPALVEGNPFTLAFDIKTGAPVCYIREDDTGFAGYIVLFGLDTVLRFCILQYVRMEKKLVEFNGKRHAASGRKNELTLESVTGLTSIIDGLTFGMNHVTSIKVLQLYGKIGKIYAKHFPSPASSHLLINTNKFGQIALGIVKSMLEGPYTTVKVYGIDESEWEKDVYAVLDKDKFKRLQQRVTERNDKYKASPLKA